MKEGGKHIGTDSFGTVFHRILHSKTGDKFEVAIKRLKNGGEGYTRQNRPTDIRANRHQEVEQSGRVHLIRLPGGISLNPSQY